MGLSHLNKVYTDGAVSHVAGNAREGAVTSDSCRAAVLRPGASDASCRVVTGPSRPAISDEGLRAVRAADRLAVSPGFSILGDSISTLRGYIPDGWRVHYGGEARVPGVSRPSETWWGRVVEHFGGHLVSNSSFSGSVVEGFGFPAGVSDERIAALVGAGGELPDVVMVYMGINDYGWGGGRNQVMGGSASASASPADLVGEHAVEPVVDRAALERFARAYALMLDKVAALAPHAQVWCLTLAPATSPDPQRQCYKYQIRGIELDAYNAAIRDAARAAGAHIADIRSYRVSYDAVDGCHPSELGMRQLADMVIGQMDGAAPGALPASIASAPRSVRECARACCSGCPHDESTPSRWTIVCSGPDATCGPTSCA